MAGYDNQQILTGQDVDRTINAREEIFRMITEGLFFSAISASLHTVFTQRSYNIAAEEEKKASAVNISVAEDKIHVEVC